MNLIAETGTPAHAIISLWLEFREYDLILAEAFGKSLGVQVAGGDDNSPTIFRSYSTKWPHDFERDNKNENCIRPRNGSDTMFAVKTFDDVKSIGGNTWLAEKILGSACDGDDIINVTLRDNGSYIVTVRDGADLSGKLSGLNGDTLVYIAREDDGEIRLWRGSSYCKYVEDANVYTSSDAIDIMTEIDHSEDYDHIMIPISSVETRKVIIKI